MELAGPADVRAAFEPTLQPCSRGGELLTFSIDRILAPDFGTQARRVAVHKQPLGKSSFAVDKSFLCNQRYFLNVHPPSFLPAELPRAGLTVTSPAKWRRKSVSPVKLDGPSPCCYSTDSCHTDGPPTPPTVVSPYYYPTHPFDRECPVDSKTFVANWLQRQRLSPELSSRQPSLYSYNGDLKLKSAARRISSASPDSKTTTTSDAVCSEPGTTPKNRPYWLNTTQPPCSKPRDQNHPLRNDSLEPTTKKRPSCSNSNVPSPPHASSPDSSEPATKRPPSIVQSSSSSAKDPKPPSEPEPTDGSEPATTITTNNNKRSVLLSPRSDDTKPDSNDWGGCGVELDSRTTPSKRSLEDDDRCSSPTPTSRCRSSSSCGGSEPEKKKKSEEELNKPKTEQSKPTFGPSEYQKSVGEVVHKSDAQKMKSNVDKSAIFEKDLKLDDPWPVWVYCSRYSPRPSSGPRSRRQTKKEQSSDEKRCRTAFSGSQLTRLRQEFQGNPYLSEKRRLALAQDLNLTESQIKIWFQNRRAKVKRTCKEKDPLAMKLMEQGLYNHSTNKS